MGIPFNGVEKTNVHEYNVAEGWVRVGSFLGGVGVFTGAPGGADGFGGSNSDGSPAPWGNTGTASNGGSGGTGGNGGPA